MQLPRRLFKILFLILLNLSVGLALFEGLVALMLTYPTMITSMPGSLLGHMRRYYAVADRDILNGDPACVRYDTELCYTLKPGKCNFTNREFDIEVTANSLGVRDSEESLNAPDVVMVGDSFSMGWGVQNDESYPRLVERATGHKVLNAAVSSYGTAREMLLLNRAANVDWSRVKYLVVQYCSNDYLENANFYGNQNHLVISSEQLFQAQNDYHLSVRRYFPGKFLSYLILPPWFPAMLYGESPAGDPLPPRVDKDEADLFLHALMFAPKFDMSKTKIILLNLEGYSRNYPHFIQAVASKLGSDRLPPHLRNMTIIDSGSIVGPEHYYILDDHMNKTGHQAIAQELLKYIQNNE